MYIYHISILTCDTEHNVYVELMDKETIPNSHFFFCMTPYYDYFLKRFSELLKRTPQKPISIRIKCFRDFVKKQYHTQKNI